MSAPATDYVRAEREGLVARLRAVNCCAYAFIFDDAADLIEADGAEINRLTRERDAQIAGHQLTAAEATMNLLRAQRAEAALRDAEAEVARLREALREIDDLCPATQEVTTAHMMADIARDALQPRTPSHG